MNSLLETLRTEVLDLRSKTLQLTRQMWLLYVTFEDFICIRHPDRSTDLISSTLDIDTYFSGHLSNNSIPPVNLFHSLSRPCVKKHKKHSQCNGTRISNRSSVSKDLIQTGPRRIGHLTFRAESSAFMVVHRKSDSHGKDPLSSDGYQPLISANANNKIYDDSVLNSKEKQSLSKHNVEKTNISDCAHPHNCNQKEGKRNVIGPLSYSEVNIDQCDCYERRHPVFIISHQVNQNSQSGNYKTNKDQRLNTKRRGDIVCKTHPHNFFQMHNQDLQGRYQSNDLRNGLNKLAFCGPADRVNKAMGIDIRSASIKNINNRKDISNDYVLGKNTPQIEQLNKTKLNNSICQQEGYETNSFCSTHNNDNTINSNSSRQARLRVSVFDHSRIPSEIANRLFAARRREHRLRAIDEDHSNAIFQESMKCPDIDFAKRKGFYLPYAVIKSSKPAESAQENSSEVNIEWTSVQDTLNSRTSFEELLGFVKDSVLNKTSPMTISSGYESDYKQAKENKSDYFPFSKEEPFKQCHRDEVPIDYFSLSDTCMKSENQSPLNSLMRIQKQEGSAHTPSKTATLLRGPKCFMSSDKSKIRPGQHERDSQEFSYTQRHNYKLTKVTRSMYEIIHDLQTEKGQLDSRKKSKKGRCIQHSKESDRTLYRTGVNSAEDNVLHERLNRKNVTSSANDNNTDKVSKPVASALCTRCVRRTLDSETVVRRQRQNKNSYNENNEVKPSTFFDNGNSFERQLRTLLCDSPEHVLTDCNQTIDGSLDNITSHEEASLEQTNRKITFMKENERSHNFEQGTVVTGIVLRGAVNKVKHLGKEDEHVYETIPGDEYLYEEMKKIRETSSANTIRRFTTIPDLPGTFIPKEPPALPERRYQRDLPKDEETIIPVTDENHLSFPRMEHPHISSISAGTGYASVSIESILEANFSTAGNNVSAQDSGSFQSHSKGDDSDGYCSIDTTSLMQLEASYEKPWGHLYPFLESNSEQSAFQFRNLSSSGCQNRSSYFQCSGEGNRSVSFLAKPTDIGIQLSDMRLLENGKSDSSDSDSTLVPSSFDGYDIRRPIIVQATYV